ncbi:class I SAM-dependent methyltransferase [Glycomyces sp. NPDC021274]|uniref:class I SAM-dependent methyltransferase n=1 Tax=Glycomyces sp. NPDC021274 TaxID=3155120 RepID=UPI0033E657FC
MALAYDPRSVDGETLDALLYDHLNTWGASEAFYLDFVMGAANVLDVGCGTGTILRRARAEGHTGRLCGLDPDPAMLDQARESDAAEWRLAPAAEAPWKGEFDLAIMSGNAFQCLLDDETTRASLAAIRRALVDDGRFVFDTRNPVAEAWRTWNPELPFAIVDPLGEPMRIYQEAGEPDEHGVVALKAMFEAAYWEQPLVASCSLRFIGPEALDRHLAAAGFTVEQRFGTWNEDPFDPETAPSIITTARAVKRAAGHRATARS